MSQLSTINWRWDFECSGLIQVEWLISLRQNFSSFSNCQHQRACISVALLLLLLFILTSSFSAHYRIPNTNLLKSPQTGCSRENRWSNCLMPHLTGSLGSSSGVRFSTQLPLAVFSEHEALMWLAYHGSICHVLGELVLKCRARDQHLSLHNGVGQNSKGRAGASFLPHEESCPHLRLD